MTSSQLIQKRNKLMHDAGQIMQAGNVTTDKRSQFDAMMTDADTLQADIERVQRTEKFEIDQRNASRPPRAQPGASLELTDAEKEKRAFVTWMRTGQISEENRSFLRIAENRDLGVGAISAPITGGNVLVPVGFDPQLHTAQKSFGAIVGAVRQFQTDSGGPLRVALADDTSQGLTVIGEAVAATENDPGLSGFTSNTDVLTTGIVKVSNSLLTDSAFSVDEFIQNTFAARYYKGLSKFITLGNSSNIASIATGATLATTTAATSVISLGELISTYSALDASYVESASWVMSSSTRATLMGLADLNGRPLLQPDATGTPFNSIYGRPIVISAYSDPISATRTPILFGDMSSYTLRTVGSLQVARLTERYAELNETGFIGYCRAGGYNTSQAASPAIVSLKMHA